MSLTKTKTKSLPRTTGTAASALLEAGVSAADVCPPRKHGAVHRTSPTEIALDYELTDWQSEDVLKRFLEKGEGLFVWVATICNYLGRTTFSDGVLETLPERMWESRRS